MTKEQELEKIVSGARLDEVFANANFGDMSRRDVVKYSLLKFSVGFRTGHTAKRICVELGLITEKENLTKLGKRYLWYAFCNGNDL